MKKNVRIVAIALMLSAFTLPAQAASRSATVRVSCTILPVMEVSTPAALQALQNSAFSQTPVFRAPERTLLGLESNGAPVKINTNLGRGGYQVGETLRTADGHQTRLFSVTAL